MPKLMLVVALLVVATTAGAARGRSRLPRRELNLVLEAPITTWDEAIPLGNGLMGGLLWGEGNTLRLSLDRGDLWDERPAPGMPWDEFNYPNMQRLVAEGKQGEVNRIFDAPYNGTHPTKLPAGRVEVTLDQSQAIESFELELATAEGRAHLADGTDVDAFFSAAKPVGLVFIPGPAPEAIRLLAPGAVKVLGYPDAAVGSDLTAQWFVQEAAEGLSYCVCVETRDLKAGTLLAATVTSSNDDDDPLGLARERVDQALETGYKKALRPHAAYWREFWSESTVSVPDIDVMRQYYLVEYFYGAASRRGAPPMPLQGVWTADSGGLPPWKGDYHNDLNTQMTYIAYQAAGHFNEGASYLDFLWNLLPTFRTFARDFYDAPGAAVPGVMSLAGQPLGGWGQYSCSPAMGAWSGHLFYLHWRYTMDEDFLNERAYPWCREVGECLEHLLSPNDDGVLVLPLSTSPEIHNNSIQAWLIPNTNYDLACLKMFFVGLAEMADAAGNANDAARWVNIVEGLGEFHVSDDDILLLDAEQKLPGSHRHLSNIIMMHPFNLMTSDGGADEQRIIDASMEQWDDLGTMGWTGYSFSWMSCLRARVGDAEMAARMLDLYVKAFILRNGFHVNGDQTGSGFSGFTYRPFTLEGNFLAAQAVHEMVLQSWSPTPGERDTGIIRIFPAMPWLWHDASFDDLRAEGGHRVSARREGNATTWLRVVAGRDSVIRVRDNFGGREPEWSRRGVAKVGENYEVALRKGQTIEARLDAPNGPAARPDDAFEPLVIRPQGIIRANALPLRIGADSAGGNAFRGDLARIAVFDRPLSEVEMAKLFDGDASLPGMLVALDLADLDGEAARNTAVADLPARVVGEVELIDSIHGAAMRVGGTGYLEIGHDARLDCLDGLTVAAWVRPTDLVGAGMRIIDKSPVGVASAYLFDTHPGNSLRLTTRDPALVHAAELPLGEWTHVAGTVDVEARTSALYVNGKLAAGSP